MVVQGAKVYSGLYNGNIQVWHMDAYVNLPSGSRPEYHTLTGHTDTVLDIALSPNKDLLLSGADDNSARLFRLPALPAAAPPAADLD